jgi:tetratricopeptide (TPR) repeat protein
MPASTSSSRTRWLIVLACLTVYGSTLLARDFYQDDQAIIADNPYLHQGWRGARPLVTTGYWEAVQGDAAPVQEYRPALSLSFLASTATTGFDPRPMHAVNILLHIGTCLLLLELLRRRLGPTTAAASALVYAVMPIHTEAVSMLTGRSEVLCAVFLLAAWLLLDGTAKSTSLTAGVALYAGALLTKESSVLFPILLAADDWASGGRRFWDAPRRAVHAALWVCTAAYLVLRAAVLSRMLHGGVPYFSSRLTAALTLPVFALRHYLWPSLTGAGLCTDFARPLIPDSSPGAPLSWLCLAAVSAVACWALTALLRQRAAWAFWLLAPCLFLLPTSNLIFPLDSIGAERFLYIPTWGLAVGIGWLHERLNAYNRAVAAAAAVVVLSGYALMTCRRNRIYASGLSYYEAAVACNPVSSRARSALGGLLIAAGRPDYGMAQLSKAAELNPNSGAPAYNLGLYAWNRGQPGQAERLLRRSVDLSAQDADAWVLLGVVVRAQKRTPEAVSYFQTALERAPQNALGHFNLGQAYLELGRSAEGRGELARFVELAPDDPDAPKVAAFLKQVDEQNR